MVAAIAPRTVPAERAPRPSPSSDGVARPPRAESPERWQKALERAMAANLGYMQLAGGDGAWAVSSTRDPEVGYVATTDTCTCAAGRAGDPCCCHRALVRALLGILPASPPPAAVCSKCLGTGRHEEEREEEGVLVAYAVPCACPAADRWADALLGYEMDWDLHHNAA